MAIITVAAENQKIEFETTSTPVVPLIRVVMIVGAALTDVLNLKAQSPRFKMQLQQAADHLSAGIKAAANRELSLRDRATQLRSSLNLAVGLVQGIIKAHPELKLTNDASLWGDCSGNLQLAYSWRIKELQ